MLLEVAFIVFHKHGPWPVLQKAGPEDVESVEQWEVDELYETLEEIKMLLAESNTVHRDLGEHEIARDMRPIFEKIRTFMCFSDEHRGPLSLPVCWQERRWIGHGQDASTSLARSA